MAFKVEKCITKKLTPEAQADVPSLNTSRVVVDVQSDISPIMDLEQITLDLSEDGSIGDIQLHDRTVHNIIIKCPQMFDENNPYEPIVNSRCSVHLFFPKEEENDNDDNHTALAREFVVKLSIQDNCQIFFHEYSEAMNRSKHAPIIEYELDNELIGNEMLHYFVEVKKPDGKNTFYMKSRNSVNASAAKIGGGRWSVTYLNDGSERRAIALSNYINVDSAKIWYSGDKDVEDIYAPYLVFDRTKNIWLFMGEDDVLEYIYLDAQTSQMHFPQHNAYAQWSL